MAKIPVDVLKALGQKGIEIIKKNPQVVLTALGGSKKLVDFLNERKKTEAERFEKKIQDQRARGKLHYRKDRYIKFQNEILPNINNHNFEELDQLITEVESFIEQLENEAILINKPLINKRKSNWTSISTQLKNKRDNNLYYELKRLNNEVDYTSNFMPESLQLYFSKIESLEERKEFVFISTGKSREKINIDFLRA
ncbi:hypothetical protein MKY84_01180 [Chryseomicrobium sp. FSL W7-1435]|uniref:hypothetical protein n=1 Tax=Chryseomicrobium sp. FSL W7-1435 TaxID=2921704 RepID=UPI003159CFDD